MRTQKNNIQGIVLQTVLLRQHQWARHLSGFSGVRLVPYLDSKKEKKTKEITCVGLSARFQESFLERKTHLAYTSPGSLKDESSEWGLRKRGGEVGCGPGHRPHRRPANQDTCLTRGLPQTLVKSTCPPHTAGCSFQPHGRLQIFSNVFLQE